MSRSRTRVPPGGVVSRRRGEGKGGFDLPTVVVAINAFRELLEKPLDDGELSTPEAGVSGFDAAVVMGANWTFDGFADGRSVSSVCSALVAIVSAGCVDAVAACILTDVLTVVGCSYFRSRPMCVDIVFEWSQQQGGGVVVAVDAVRTGSTEHGWIDQMCAMRSIYWGRGRGSGACLLSRRCRAPPLM